MRGLLRWVMVGAVSAGSLVACGGGGGGGQGPSVTIAKGGAPNGDGQSAVVATALSTSLKVLVQEDGAARAGVTVAWSSTTAGSVFTPASSVTDASGEATTQWTLGTVAGSQTARAALAGAGGSPVSFTATAAAGAATAFARSAGDGQSAAVSAAFGTALAVKVADQFGNGIAGAVVDWSVQSGPVTLTGGAQSVTSAAGIATKGVDAGATPGPGIVRASTASVAGTDLDFNLTVTAAPVLVTVGNNFFRSVKNATQDPAIDTAAIGQPVRWSVTGTHRIRSLGTPSFPSSGNLNTGATFQLTFSTPGTYEYDCSIHGAAAMSGRVEVVP